MKLNSLPTRADDRLAEVKIVNDRLNDLFSAASDKHRQVALSNKGLWLDDNRHVKLDSVRGISSQLLSYSTEYKYDYLEPFEALYCMESNQLLIYRNGVPLSLAEAYQLILNDAYLFRNYRVFQQLNRSGYVCLSAVSVVAVTDESHIEPEQKEGTDSAETLSPKTTIATTTTTTTKTELAPLFCLDAIQLPFNEVMTKLQHLGPQEQLEPQNIGPDDTLEATFEVYKRETYAKRKPRKGKPGEPDYVLIVSDRSELKQPNSKQILHLASKHVSAATHQNTGLNQAELQPATSTYEQPPGIMLALVDDDYSICFGHFKPMSLIDPH